MEMFEVPAAAFAVYAAFVRSDAAASAAVGGEPVNPDRDHVGKRAKPQAALDAASPVGEQGLDISPIVRVIVECPL
ncbi:hypothetical protein ACF08N_37985 [Streptomyces sp. NPDC015127]|uniref:hypothetical protein n=1 Tax=Streptomyces sp. NPDC015127 TaxID=3364939 RepID=UPI0036FD4C84